MASSHNVELEAAKFLHKLIQDSKDEPAKLATKLYVILQHMKSSGKEHSMPYQVISRAMETVINQHGLDIEALKSSRLPLTGGAQIGSSQAVGVPKDSRVGLTEHDMSKMEPFASNRPPVAPSSGAPDYYQGSVAQRSSQSFDQESPSSLDSRSANSQSQDRRDTANWEKQGSQKDGKKAATKRKRGDTSSPVEPHVDGPSQLDSRNTVVNARKGKMTKAEPSDGLPVKSGAYGKAHGGMAVATGAYPLAETAFSSPMQYGGGGLEHDGGSAATLADAHKVAQIGRQNSATESAMPRQSGPPRDTGKLPFSGPASSSTPFREQQLKQLRAQCLVFLAFRNGLPPKKLHLEIALGTTFSREDGSRKELIDQKGKSQSSNEPNSASGMMMPFGGLNNMRQTDKNPTLSSPAGKILEADSFSKGVESPNVMEDKGNLHSDVHALLEERKHLLSLKKGEVERQIQERVAAQAFSNPTFQQHDSVSGRGSLVVNNHLDDVDNSNMQFGRSNQTSTVMGLNKPVNPDGINWSGFVSHNDTLKGPLQVPAVQHELPVERRENIPSHFQNIGNNNGGPRNHSSVSHLPSYSLKEHWKPVPGTDSDPQGVTMLKDEQEGNERFASAEMPASPRYTMSEKWIMDQHKRRLLIEQNWVRKQQKTRQKIVSCYDKLKENVNSSEDISAKTKSVIELKKLQLLDLQRRLRSGFLNDFFKPITSEMDHLKSIKKHRHGRRIKQLERFEQKMKEERQKRIRERQKEFFSEIEVHKERLDDAFKIKRERWKGFNRYVKEFHKRKERIHREKIDRIQREKINLLKINDVEGYLRMVQDAKSDRVKQLLKETEKYLQKLGSKLQEAKTVAGRFEHDVDEAGNGSVFEKNETTLENEDESDQAKHYLESNEKYYMMAHSIKESIAEQPSSLQGGKLREYQMNGLRWLVSLYNNHLNGILADEMGLGKTVQVIALICYLMETKNDRGPFLVVVPSSVLPGWESEINFWAPGVHKIVYSGPPEERRRLFKERIVHQKFNVLLTTYEYLMNKHDRPKLSKIHWHYVIIDEGHRIKNASCKLNADLKHYQSSHRLLLTGTPLQNNLEELWALLNFLLPNIFNSSEDFSQWFNKPFQSNGDSSPDEALLSEEENLLIINRLHQVLRPFVLRRLKHKVENELPEKIERLVRCEASAYQKLLMKRVEENLGSIGASKARSVHNSVMELRNICNHPYLSQLHAEEVDNYIPKHYLPPIVRLCGKLEMLDRLLPKLKATDHRVLFFSTMTRLLDVMEEYLTVKQYRYLRLDGHTSGSDRGALIDLFNQPGSPFFIFLLSIRAGGVGVNLQAADTVIIFDTDWNPQVDLQAQARAHRIGQKRDVLVLRFETVQTVEEQVRAAAEHKLGVANQSITAGFFDNNTSAEDRREYLESLLRECKKEEAAPVLDDDALNDLLARSEMELDIFEAVDKKRREEEMTTWKKLMFGQAADSSDLIIPLPPRLVTDDDLKNFYEAMKIYDVPKGAIVPSGVKRKSEYLGGLDTQQYGRGKRAREVRSYEEQWTEEEFEKMCQVESPGSPKVKEEVVETSGPANSSNSVAATSNIEPEAIPPSVPSLPPVEIVPVQQTKEITPPAKRGRGRPKRITSDKSPAAVVSLAPPAAIGVDKQLQRGTLSAPSTSSSPQSSEAVGTIGPMQHSDSGIAPTSQVAVPLPTAVPEKQSTAAAVSVPIQARGQGRKTQSGGEAPRRRGKKLAVVSSPVSGGSGGPDSKLNEQLEDKATNSSVDQAFSQSGTVTSNATIQHPNIVSASTSLDSGKDHLGAGISLNSQVPTSLPSAATAPQTAPTFPSVPTQNKGQSRKSQSGGGAPRRRGKKQESVLPVVPDTSGQKELHINSSLQVSSGSALGEKGVDVKSLTEDVVQESKGVIQEQVSLNPGDHDLKLSEKSDDLAKQTVTSPSNITKTPGSELQNSNVHDSASVAKGSSSQFTSSDIKISDNSGNETVLAPTLPLTAVTKDQTVDGRTQQPVETSKPAPSNIDSPASSIAGSATMESIGKSSDHMDAKVASSVPSSISCSPPLGSESSHPCPLPSESVPVKRQGRKTQNRADPPRRRGKRQASALPVPSAPAVQDPKLSQLSHNSPGDKAASIASHGGEVQEWTNANQSQQFQIHLPSGTAVPDSKRKERAFNFSQNKQQRGSSSRGDGASGSPDKVAATGRIQNVNDVARVMKEVFSGTCLAKPKAHDSVGIEDKNSPIIGATTKTAVEELNNQSCDNKQCSDMPTSGATSVTPVLSVDKHEKLSEEVLKAQNPEDEMNSEIPTSEATGFTSVVPVNGNEKHSGTSSDSKAVVNEIMTVSEPEIRASDFSQKEQIQNCIESSSTQIEAGAQHDASSLNAAQENVSLNSLSAALQKSAGSSPLEVGGTGCGTIPLETDNSSNNAVASQAGTFNLDCSATAERSGIAENTSDKLSPNAKNPSSPLASCHGGGSRFVSQPEAVGGQSELIPSSPAATPHSRTMEVSGMSEHGEINSEKETDYSLPVSAELSLDDSKTSISANIDDSNSGEPIVQSSLPASSDSLEPEMKITIEDNSQNALEPYSKQSSKSPEMEGFGSPRPFLADLKPSDSDNFDVNNSNKLEESLVQSETIKCYVDASVKSPPSSPKVIDDEAAPTSSTDGFNLHETQPLEGHLEPFCEEKVEEWDDKCEQLQAVVANPTNSDMETDTFDSKRINVSPVKEIVPENASSIDMSSSFVNEEEKLKDHAHEDPIDTAMVSQPSGLEAAVDDSVVVFQDGDLPKSTTSSKKTEEEKLQSSVSEDIVNDSVGVSQVGDIVADITSDSAVLPSSSLVQEENRTSSEMNLVKDSEPLEESMEEDLHNSSVAPEETKVSIADTNVQMDSSDGHVLHEDCKISQEDLNVSSSCLMENKEKLAGSITGIQSSSVLPLDELKDSKIEAGSGNITQDGDALSGDETSMNLCLPSSLMGSKEERVACLSDDGSQASTLGLPKCSDTLGDKKEVSQVDVVETVIDSIPSQVKDKEQEVVSFDNNSVVRSVSHEGMDGSKVDQSNYNASLQAGDILPQNAGLEINIMPSVKEVKDFKLEICDEKEASKSLDVDPEQDAFKMMDAPSSSLLTNEDKIAASSNQVPQCSSPPMPEESRNLSTLDESYREALSVLHQLHHLNGNQITLRLR
ncbi:chromatin structure-remodeling complex protein SYD isoform X2 [Neltuma alba]|uniref:chromatin structure-remodeling complex protein SYD isoform X2 n=1 Tax=Neltuma alba TaxID=207710 RepID=UPI0010A50B56|nr:chromatin structure-remodeling complex protein SYD isoform X2 [Prosopis alba]